MVDISLSRLDGKGSFQKKSWSNAWLAVSLRSGSSTNNLSNRSQADGSRIAGFSFSIIYSKMVN